MSGKKIATYLGSAAVALALGALVASSTALAGGGTKLEVDLVGIDNDPVASGSAKFEYRSDRTRFSAEVEDVVGTVDDVFTVQVCHEVSGTEVCSDVGNPTTITLVDIQPGPGVVLGGDLNLDTRDNDTVTSMNDGDVIKVFDGNSLGATLILEGTLDED